MNKQRTIVRWAAVWTASILVGVGASARAADEKPVDPKAKAFEELVQKVQKEAGGATDADVLQLLKLANELGQPYTASLAAKSYLARSLSPAPEVLRSAADNALAAGDLRTAVARYKAYLKNATPSKEASDAAASLYTILVDYLNTADDAFATMTLYGDSLRQSVPARKFDRWFLDQAQARRDYTAQASRLARIMSEKLPIEQERWLFWPSLDWLMKEISRGEDNMLDALPAVRRVLAGIREDDRRSKEYAVYVARLGYRAGAAGKDKAALVTAYQPVLDAAKAYFDAFPGAEALQNIFIAFLGGHGTVNAADVAVQGDAMRQFFLDAFARLKPEDQKTIITWNNRGHLMHQWMATPQQWADLGIKYADLFKSMDLPASMTFDYQAADPERYKAQAAFLAGQDGIYAAIINSLAASPDDLNKCIDHLVQNESWHLEFNEVSALVRGHLWPYFSRYKREKDKALAADYGPKALLRFGAEYVAKTPIALFDTNAARDYVLDVWNSSGKDDLDKSQVAAALHSLDWVPWGPSSRRQVFAPVYEQFKRWVEALRKREKAKDAAVTEPVLAQITPLEQAFKDVMEVKVTDIKKAPNPLCAKLAEQIVAANDGKWESFNKLAMDLYEQVAEWHVKKTPLGKAVLGSVLRSEPVGATITPVQARAMKEHMLRYAPGQPVWPIEYVANAVLTSRPNWRVYNIPAKDKKEALAINAAVGEALKALVESDRYYPPMLDWWRGTRYGSGWDNWDAGLDVLTTLIEKKTLVRFRHDAIWPSGTSSFQWLVANRAQGLGKQYPADRYFDDMFVAEATERGTFDWQYWAYGRDTQRKVFNAAAKHLAGFDRLPFGYGDQPRRYDPNTFWNWQYRALGADAAVRDEMVSKIEATYGKSRFDEYAMGRAYFNINTAVKTAPQRKEYFERLAQYVQRAAATHDRVSLPYLQGLADVDPGTLTAEEAAVLVMAVRDATPDNWTASSYHETLALLAHQAMVKLGREADLFAMAPQFWRLAKQTGNATFQRQLAQLARDMVLTNGNGDKGGKAGATQTPPSHVDLATVYSLLGMDMLGADLPEDIRTSLMSVRSKALVNVGGVIPVSRADPRYPIFASQASFLAGKTAEAWDQFLARRDLVQTMLKDLDANYVIWLVTQNTEAKQFDAAEQLARSMLQWTESTPQSFDAEVRGSLVLAYADIAYARQEYPRARAWYERIAATKEFEGTLALRRAELRVAEVDRVTRQYDSAEARLEKLVRSPDRRVQADAYYQWALLRYDQEQFVESKQLLDEVFARTPGHADARILQGELNLKLRKLEEAREVAVGLASDKRFIVPGKPLRVSLEDRNLAIVGSGANIEIRAWTDHGDEETFVLFPKGDSRTKFDGQLPTELAPVKKGDRALQVGGGGMVYYNFSPRFLAGRKDADEFAPAALRVMTDPQIFASSGRILTPEELEERALEDLIRRRLQLNADHLKKMLLDDRRAEDEVKPGNPINVRVIDPDQSTTDKKDKIRIRVATSSGDRIDAFELEETEPFSGVFEGAIPTSTGQATAYASDSEEGRDANFAISAGEWPAWVALPDNRRPKIYSVDLNDNVELGKAVLLANVPGRKLKDFIVQTSMNGRDFQTIGRWPMPHEPWDGSLRLEIVRFPSGTRPPTTLEQFTAQIEREYLNRGDPKVTMVVDALEGDWNRDILNQGNALKLQWQDWYIAHFYGAFEQPRTQVRTFRLDPRGRTRNITYLLAIDSKVEENPLVVSRSLTEGVHRIDVYIAAYRHANPSFVVQCDTLEPPYMVSLPREMFDPAKNPKVRDAVYVEPAKISASEQKDKFDFEFARGTRGRILRLLLADFETDAPAIAKLTLQDAGGGEILPTKEDFTKLKQNRVLEIVPGDRITINYEDPSVITPEKATQTAFLSASFANAELSACFVEYELNQQGQREPQYIPMRRFQPGDAVKVFIRDPDHDVSEQMDTVEFTARVKDGKPVTLKALETAEHSGIFMGTVLPVDRAAQGETEVQVAAGQHLELSFFDRENTDPGVATWRHYTVESSQSAAPQLRVYEHTTMVLPPEQRRAEASQLQEQRFAEFVPVSRTVLAQRPAQPLPADQAAKVLVDGPLIVELLYPPAARSPASEASIYVQTSSGRALYGQPIPEGSFDVNVPGTIKLTRTPGDPTRIEAPAGYQEAVVRGNPYAANALDEGRFTFDVPVAMGDVPNQTLIHEAEKLKHSGTPASPLSVRGSDTLFVGFSYENQAGETAWLVQKVELISDVFFHVMDRRYQELVKGAHVGETVYFRVIHKVMDREDGKDTLTLKLTTQSGKQRDLELMESFGHTGVFKGLVRLEYAGEKKEETDPTVLPVVYGDVITAIYTPTAPGEGQELLTQTVQVYKGADGIVLPFTKRFKDPEIAVQTHFSIAEAYFELAKKHRELGQESLVRREIAQGKKLLEEALRDFPDTEHRAQADYLLANLAFEFATDAKNEQMARDFQVEAINRFSDIVATYPDSPYAPKAQYKKALVLEKMGQIDAACEEYVKLSYRYPENELVAETIARLGQYFLTKGRGYDEQAAELQDPVEREKLKIQARNMFTTSAEVFGRLSQRFPNHKLSGKTDVLSAQCYLRAENYEKAIAGFKKVYENPEADNELASEAMYWAGDTHMRSKDLVSAYRVFKKLTWDYPESKWAKYARGRLTDDALLKVAESDAGG